MWCAVDFDKSSNKRKELKGIVGLFSDNETLLTHYTENLNSHYSFHYFPSWADERPRQKDWTVPDDILVFRVMGSWVAGSLVTMDFVRKNCALAVIHVRHTGNATGLLVYELP